MIVGEYHHVDYREKRGFETAFDDPTQRSHRLPTATSVDSPFSTHSISMRSPISKSVPMLASADPSYVVALVP